MTLDGFNPENQGFPTGCVFFVQTSQGLNTVRPSRRVGPWAAGNKCASAFLPCFATFCCPPTLSHWDVPIT